MTDLNPEILYGDCAIDLYAQYAETVLTVNYYSNNATQSYQGSLNADQVGEGKNVLVRTVKYEATKEQPYGLHNYVNDGANRNIYRDYHTGTGYWGTEREGGKKVQQSTGFKTGMALAEALGVSIENKDVTVNVYPQWRKNKLTILYNVNGGTLNSLSGKAFSIDNEGYILKDGKKDFQITNFDEYIMDESNGFYDWNSQGNIYIGKSGYVAKKGIEWNTKPDGSGKSYNQTLPFIAKDLADLKSKDQTLTVYVNWMLGAYLDVNGHLDGAHKENISGFGTFDLYIDGKLAGNDIPDAWRPLPKGATYEIKDIKAKSGKKYMGVKEGSLSGTIGEKRVVVKLEFKTVTDYTVNYNGNGATAGSMDSSVHTVDAANALMANKYTKTGYIFTGWNTKADGSGTAYADKASVKNLTAAGETITLYAQWKPKTITVTFHRNISSSDTTTATQTFTYDMANQSFSAKGWAKSGYTLKKWTMNRDGSGNSYNVLSGVTNNWINTYSPSVHLYAQWEVKIVSWATGSDAEIVNMVQAADRGEIALSDHWKVGDTRKVTLSAMSASGVGESHGSQTVELVLMHKGGYKLTNGKECSFVVGQKNCLNEAGYMNADNSYSSGWEGSARRAWCNTTYKNAFPASLQPIFKQFRTISAASYNGTGTKTTNDYFALPSEREIFGVRKYSNQAEYDNQFQLEYYKTAANRIKTVNGSSSYYWGRSLISHTNQASSAVSNSGSTHYYSAFLICGIAPFGCI